MGILDPLVFLTFLSKIQTKFDQTMLRSLKIGIKYVRI